jgi:hypothetical protein
MWLEIAGATFWVAKKLFETATGRAAEGVLDTIGNAFRSHRPEEGHIQGPPERSFTSRFATSLHELDVVLRLRRAYFHRHLVSPDDSYRQCWKNNPCSMKVVYDLFGEPIGYWAVVPIAKETFNRFIKGGEQGITHAEMLQDHALSWSAVQRAEVRLYIIGAVVPVPEGRNQREYSLLQKMISWRVLLDSFQFGIELMDRVTLRAVCGYPSRTGGYTTLDAMGFAKTKVCIAGDPRQPIFSMTCSRHLTRVRDRLAFFIRNHAHEVPVWDPGDRLQFFGQLGGNPVVEARAPSVSASGRSGAAAVFVR